MENNADLFDGEALGFDSTLDGLFEVDSLFEDRNVFQSIDLAMAASNNNLTGIDFTSGVGADLITVENATAEVNVSTSQDTCDQFLTVKQIDTQDIVADETSQNVEMSDIITDEKETMNEGFADNEDITIQSWSNSQELIATEAPMVDKKDTVQLPKVDFEKLKELRKKNLATKAPRPPAVKTQPEYLEQKKLQQQKVLKRKAEEKANEQSPTKVSKSENDADNESISSKIKETKNNESTDTDTETKESKSATSKESKSSDSKESKSRDSKESKSMDRKDSSRKSSSSSKEHKHSSSSKDSKHNGSTESKPKDSKETKHSSSKDSKHSSSKDSKHSSSKDSKHSSSKDSKSKETKESKSTDSKESKPPDSKDSKLSSSKDSKHSSSKDSKHSSSKESKSKENQESKKASSKESKNKDGSKASDNNDAKQSEKQESKQRDSKESKPKDGSSKQKDCKQIENKESRPKDSKESKNKESKDSKQSDSKDVKRRDSKDTKQKDNKETETKDYKQSDSKEFKPKENKDSKRSDKDTKPRESKDSKHNVEKDSKQRDSKTSISNSKDSAPESIKVESGIMNEVESGNKNESEAESRDIIQSEENFVQETKVEPVENLEPETESLDEVMESENTVLEKQDVVDVNIPVVSSSHITEIKVEQEGDTEVEQMEVVDEAVSEDTRNEIDTSNEVDNDMDDFEMKVVDEEDDEEDLYLSECIKLGKFDDLNEDYSDGDIYDQLGDDNGSDYDYSSDTIKDDAFGDDSFHLDSFVGEDRDVGKVREKDDGEADIKDDEVYDMLEAGVGDNDKKSANRNEIITKVVLEERGTDPFDILPEDWTVLNHNSGIPIYLNKVTRVVTLSRPYFIGSGSMRKHAIPISAIPCLQYKKALEQEALEKLWPPAPVPKSTATDATGTATTGAADGDKTQANKPPNTPTACPLDPPVPKIQNAEDVCKAVYVEPEDVHAYCKRLFKFKSLTVHKFRTWKEKREAMLDRKKRAIPRLGPDTKLITCAIPDDGESFTRKAKKKEFVLNPEGKTAVCILHEYAQNVLKSQPKYQFKQIENAETPYMATIFISGMQYGTGIASGKKQAKNEAAKRTLEVFMPFLREQWKGSTAHSKHAKEQEAQFQFFENITIEDPRVTELCNKAALNKPFQILQDCLKRNFGLGDTTMRMEKKLISNQKTEFTLTVGKHSCTIMCKNKRDAKQLAAQAMLKKLHPNLTNWASILRLYNAPATNNIFNETPKDEVVQDKQKNFEILANLKQAMLALKQKKDVMTPGNTKATTAELQL